METMQSIIENILSPEIEKKIKGIELIRQTDFYCDNKCQIVTGGYADNITLEELVGAIERRPEKSFYSAGLIPFFWNLEKEKYNEEGNKIIGS